MFCYLELFSLKRKRWHSNEILCKLINVRNKNLLVHLFAFYCETKYIYKQVYAVMQV
jgi:hypothetical protein